MPRRESAIPAEKIAANLAAVRRRIRDAATKAGRDPASIRLVVVTKYSSAEETAALIRLGERDLGEARVQETESKLAALRTLLSERELQDVRVHLIGHLQTNKANKAVRIFDTIHSLDSLKLAVELDKEARKVAAPTGHTRPLRCLIEINAGEEAQKFGLPPRRDALLELLKACAPLEHIQLAGVMAMAPYAEEPESTSRPLFKRVRELLAEANAAHAYPRYLGELSMGMTQDFEIAIEEGATLVRVGTAITN
jgi:pyridoxal phosphate enzyme (YggS family)